MSKKSVVILGDSHVFGVVRSLKDTRESSSFNIKFARAVCAANELYDPFFEERGDDIVFTRDIMRSRMVGPMCDEEGVLRIDPSVFQIWSMGMHTYTFLSGPRWEGHKHWTVQGLGNHQPVSDAVFEALVLDMHKHVLSFCKALKIRGYSFAIVATPPPTRRFKQLGMGYSEHDLLAVDGRMRAIMIREFKALDIEVIMPPKGVSDEGFLKEEFLQENPADHHHGNAKYAGLMVKKLSEYVQAQ